MAEHFSSYVHNISLIATLAAKHVDISKLQIMRSSNDSCLDFYFLAVKTEKTRFAGLMLRWAILASYRLANNSISLVINRINSCSENIFILSASKSTMLLKDETEGETAKAPYFCCY